MKDYHGINITHQSIYNLQKKCVEEQGVADIRPDEGFPPGVTEEIIDSIHAFLDENDELTGKQLQEKIKSRHNVNFSITKIFYLRRRLGWVCSGSSYCQMIKHVNRPRRLEYAAKKLEENDQFNDCIFTDECTIQMESNGPISFHRWWELAVLKCKPKHSLKVHVWGGITKHGPTPVLIFEGIMEKKIFVKSILTQIVEPFVREYGRHRFIQDNDPKHTSNLAKEHYAKLGINWVPTPPESPDMNPIENLWHVLKHYIRTVTKPQKKEGLIKAISDFWENLTPERCSRHINHLQKVLPAVIEQNGEPTGF